MKKILLGLVLRMMKFHILIFIISFNIISCQEEVLAATGWDITKPAGTSDAADLDARIIENNTAINLMLSTYRQDCALAYASASTLTVSSGGVMVSNSGGTVRLMVANTSNTTVSWANIDTGAEANGTTYYIYAVASGTTASTFTVMISTNSSAPTGATYYRRLGSFYNDGSGNITSIVNDSFTGELGSWESKSTGTTYQATTDGFVTAYGTGGAATGISLTGYTDSSSTPTTIRVYQVIQSGLVNPDSPQAISFPVKKGDYWKVVIATGSATVYWISSD